MLPVARQQLPTPAALNELTLSCKPRTPRTGFGTDHRQDSTPALSLATTIIVATNEKRVVNQSTTCLTDTASRPRIERKVFPHRPLSVFNAKENLLDRTLVLIDPRLLQDKWSMKMVGVTPTSLH